MGLRVVPSTKPRRTCNVEGCRPGDQTIDGWGEFSTRQAQNITCVLLPGSNPAEEAAVGLWTTPKQGCNPALFHPFLHFPRGGPLAHCFLDGCPRAHSISRVLRDSHRPVLAARCAHKADLGLLEIGHSSNHLQVCGGLWVQSALLGFGVVAQPSCPIEEVSVILW